MLNVLFIDDFAEDADAEKASGREMMLNSDASFRVATRNLDLNKDEFLLSVIDRIDNCYLLAPDVLCHRPTGRTSIFDKISGGAKVLWLMNNYSDKFIFPACFMGENCYQIALDIGKTKDVFVYDDADMFFAESNGHSLQNCHGKLFDVYKNTVVDLDAPGFNCIEYFDAR